VNREGSLPLAVVQRQLKAVNPAHIVPPIVIPLLFFAAFAGGLSSIADTPEFTYPDYTGFIWIFVLFMGTSFAAVFRGFAMVADFETGFARRMMLTAPQRMSIVMGFVIAALGQAVLVSVILFGVALLAGMDLGGSVPQVLAIFVLAIALNAAVMLYAAGVALRLPTLQTGSLFMIMPVFIFLFVAPVYLPREELSGWLKTAAGINPFTPLFEAGRGLLAGSPESVALAFGVVAGMIVLGYVWALTGMQRITR
jgi:ABC-2 type transport system permease protein